MQHIDLLRDRGTEIKHWALGGGTALMVQMHHRQSKDIDIFVPDPQYLGYLSPRVSESDFPDVEGYSEEANYVKLAYAEGEIDFIVSGRLTDLPAGNLRHEAWDVPLEHPAEIAVKKLHYRGAWLTPRDVFDIAVVLHEHEEALVQELGGLSEVKPALMRALSGLDSPAYRQALDELPIFEPWISLRDTALPAVTALAAAIPPPTPRQRPAPVDSSVAWWQHEPITPSRSVASYLAFAEVAPTADIRRLAMRQASVRSAAASQVVSTVGPLLGQQAHAATAYMRAHTVAANLQHQALGAATVIYQDPEKALVKALGLATQAGNTCAIDAIRNAPSICGDLVGGTTFGIPDHARRAALAALPAYLGLVHSLHHSHANLHAAAAGAPSANVSERARLMDAWQTATIDLSAPPRSQGLALSPQVENHAEAAATDLPPLPSWWQSEIRSGGSRHPDRGQVEEADREP